LMLVECSRFFNVIGTVFSAMSWSAGWTESSGNRGFGYSCAWGPSASVKVIQSQYTPKIIQNPQNGM
jgi:hypothetical protein